MIEKHEIGWYAFQHDCYELAKQIRKGVGLVIPPILAVSRGGLTPATIISHQLDQPQIDFIGVSSYENETQYDLKIYHQPRLGYNSVLIIDDLVESGRTLDLIKDMLILDHPSIIIYTAVVYSKNENYEVDFKIKELDPKKWVVFPYEQGGGTV